MKSLLNEVIGSQQVYMPIYFGHQFTQKFKDTRLKHPEVLPILITDTEYTVESLYSYIYMQHPKSVSELKEEINKVFLETSNKVKKEGFSSIHEELFYYENFLNHSTSLFIDAHLLDTSMGQWWISEALKRNISTWGVGDQIPQKSLASNFIQGHIYFNKHNDNAIYDFLKISKKVYGIWVPEIE